jgi:hypothetical protein
MTVASTRMACAHPCGKLINQHYFDGDRIAHHPLCELFGSLFGMISVGFVVAAPFAFSASYCPFPVPFILRRRHMP